MASMSALGRPTEPAALGMREFHRRKREVYGLLRGLDRESRETMRGFDVKGG
jgi:D-ribulokinase